MMRDPEIQLLINIINRLTMFDGEAPAIKPWGAMGSLAIGLRRGLAGKSPGSLALAVGPTQGIFEVRQIGLES